jgi:nicotinate-nucleotide adenylyltransferase
MKIGLYFGSFNPIHIGHLIIATYVINNTDFKKIWFVVSPQNPLKPSKSLLNEYQRLHLVRLAIEDDYNLMACDVEFKLSKPSYTIDTIIHLKEKYPQHQFAIIMGSDSFQNIHKWKNYQKLIDDNKVIILKRPGFEINKIYPSLIILNNTPLLEISSTTVRNMIKEGKSIRYLVPEKVRIEIESCGYFESTK